MHRPWVSPFLTALASTGVVARAAQAAGVASAAVYALRKQDDDFAAAWDLALEDAMDDIEAAARQRALGFEELVVYQGQLTPVYERDSKGELVMEPYELTDSKGVTATHQRPRQERLADGSLRWLTVTKHSDAMVSLLLKGRRKKVFADRTELTGADGAPVAIDATARRARIASILAAAEARSTASDIA